MKNVVFELPENHVFTKDVDISKFYGWYCPEYGTKGVFVGDGYSEDLFRLCKRNGTNFSCVKSNQDLIYVVSDFLGGKEQTEIFEFNTETELTNWVLSPIV